MSKKENRFNYCDNEERLGRGSKQVQVEKS